MKHFISFYHLNTYYFYTFSLRRHLNLTLDKKKDRSIEDFKCWHCVGLKGGQNEDFHPWCVDSYDLETHKHDLDLQKLFSLINQYLSNIYCGA